MGTLSVFRSPVGFIIGHLRLGFSRPQPPTQPAASQLEPRRGNKFKSVTQRLRYSFDANWNLYTTNKPKLKKDKIMKSKKILALGLSGALLIPLSGTICTSMSFAATPHENTTIAEKNDAVVPKDEAAAQAKVKKTREAWQASRSAAKAQFDSGSKGFFEEVGAKDAIAQLQTDYKVSDGTPLISYTHIGDPKDATSLKNMASTFQWMRKANALRAQWGDVDGSPAGPLKVTDELMAIAQVNTNWSTFHHEHSHNGYGENIAWGYSDPFTGWFDAEKKIYDSKGKGVTGHYTNIVNHEYGVTGFAVRTGDREGYGVTHLQQFNWGASAFNRKSQRRQPENCHTQESIDQLKAQGINPDSIEWLGPLCSDNSSSESETPESVATGAYTVDEYEKRFQDYYQKIQARMRYGDANLKAKYDAAKKELSQLQAKRAAVSRPERLAGPSGVETSVNVAKHAWGDKWPVVYVASNHNPVDALAAGTLGDGPVVLTDGVSLNLGGVKPEQIVILGGSKAVPANIEAQAASLVGATNVTRLQGGDRNATAEAVANRWQTINGLPKVVYVTRNAGMGSPDAVAGSVLRDGPILTFTNDASIAAAGKKIKEFAPEKVIVLGGEAVATPPVVAQLVGKTSWQRWSGSDRYQTAAIVAKNALAQKAGRVAYIAAGTALKDAMVAGAVNDGVILLTPNTGAGVRQQRESLKLESVIGVGGIRVLPEAVLAAIR